MDSLFDLVEHTTRSVFLTGRAGTGKTTFLNELTKKTKKNFAVVAPTGIAAINAGGSTIHSMFGLPLSTFVPTSHDIDRNKAINIPQLLPHLRYQSAKLKLLRSLELLIVDEVSMLRADVLDMMDIALRKSRRSPAAFGGVQLLFVGDLYQLPPVVKDTTENVLYEYYRSPYFFDAKAFERLQLLTVELNKVYRQTDAAFLNILNAIREKDVDNIDFEKLNSRYQPSFEEDEGYVQLVSHNYMADAINNQKLQSLTSKSFNFPADINGDFRESMYPNGVSLELKVGAQVMFIRNDTSPEKQYFNGRLATISYIDKEKISVQLKDSKERIDIRKELWENKKYVTDKEGKIKEDVVGSYKQYPIRLAWAVTIHKSQGLTMDKVIIDAGKSFANGQVYVALSRCRTLEGIVLKSKITTNILFDDNRIHDFHKETNANDKVDNIIADEKYHYVLEKLLRQLNMSWMDESLQEWYDVASISKFLDKSLTEKMYTNARITIKDLIDVETKFERLIHNKLKTIGHSNAEWLMVEDKSSGAVNYFFDRVKKEIFTPTKDLYVTIKGKKGLKEHNKTLEIFLQEVETYLNQLKKTALFERNLYVQKDEDVIDAKVEKIPTHILSYQLFEKGKSIAEIAKERDLTEGTIYGHLAKMAATGVVDISRIFSEEKIAIFKKVYDYKRYESLNDWKENLPQNFEYNEIRLLVNHFDYLKEKKS